jgi:hemerythrin
MYINWDRKYESGQPLIDAEHRLLVMLFKKLDVAIKTNLSDSTWP